MGHRVAISNLPFKAPQCCLGFLNGSQGVVGAVSKMGEGTPVRRFRLLSDRLGDDAAQMINDRSHLLRKPDRAVEYAIGMIKHVCGRACLCFISHDLKS